MAKRKPPPENTGRNQARREALKARAVKAAAEIVQGATVTAAAKAAGITSRQIYGDLRQPEIQATLAALYKENAERFRMLFERSLDVIEDSLEATLVEPGPVGPPIDTDLADGLAWHVA